MMEFNINHKVKIETMTKEEATAFIKFLRSEIRRHQMDISDAKFLIEKVKEVYNL